MAPKLLTSFLLILLVALSAAGQTRDSFLINKFQDNMFFVRMDSVHSSQTTVLEYPNYLVLIELPFVDMGANKSADLYEDIATADSFLTFLKREFKNKPVKYVLSTHWHLHSLSAITPFFKQGAKLVAAESNWNYSIDNKFLGNINPASVSKNVIKIKRDTTLLSKTKFPIDVIFLDSTFTHKPTKDYLFFYFPKVKTLHASCMNALSEVDFEKRKDFIYSDRISDLNSAIASRTLNVDYIIKLGRFEQSPGRYLPPVFSGTYLNDFSKNGKPMHVVVKEYTEISLTDLINHKDSILKALVNKKVSPQILNQATYNLLKEKQYEKAVLLAQLLNLYTPGVVNYIDTLGEAYFASGDLPMAAHYDALMKQLDPKSEGGMKNWEQNKINHTY